MQSSGQNKILSPPEPDYPIIPKTRLPWGSNAYSFMMSHVMLHWPPFSRLSNVFLTDIIDLPGGEDWYDQWQRGTPKEKSQEKNAWSCAKWNVSLVERREGGTMQCGMAGLKMDQKLMVSNQFQSLTNFFFKISIFWKIQDANIWRSWSGRDIYFQPRGIGKTLYNFSHFLFSAKKKQQHFLSRKWSTNSIEAKSLRRINNTRWTHFFVSFMKFIFGLMLFFSFFPAPLVPLQSSSIHVRTSPVA